MLQPTTDSSRPETDGRRDEHQQLMPKWIRHSLNDVHWHVFAPLSTMVTSPVEVTYSPDEFRTFERSISINVAYR